MTRAYSDSLLDSAVNTSDGKTVDPRMPSDQSPVISPNSDGAHPEDSWSPQHVRGQHMNRASEPQLGTLLDEAGLTGDGSPRDGKARHGSYHHHHHHHGHSHPAGSARRHHHRHPAPIPVDGEKLLPPVSCPLFLPNGHVHRSHINELVPLFEASRVNYTDFYSLACQPVSRSMKGDLVRQLAELVTSQRFAKLRFLTGLREALVDITQHPNGVIAFSFDFKGKKTLVLYLVVDGVQGQVEPSLLRYCAVCDPGGNHAFQRQVHHRKWPGRYMMTAFWSDLDVLVYADW